MPRFSLATKWHTPCYEKLSALKWPAGFSIASYGVKIGVRASDPSLMPMLQERLPANCTPCHLDAVDAVLSVVLGGKQSGTRHRRYHLVYHNHSVFSRSHDLEDVVDGFRSCLAVTQATLARRRVFIHAGAVGWRGKAIIIPGKSYSGKSTLVMELIKAGASYLSDEFAVLDFQGRIHPYPKPISIRKAANGKQVDVSVESIGGLVEPKPLPLGLMVDTQFRSDATWEPKMISPGEGLLAMLSNCSAARLSPERCIRAMKRASQKAMFIASRRGEAAIVGRQILDIQYSEHDIDRLGGAALSTSSGEYTSDLQCPA